VLSATHRACAAGGLQGRCSRSLLENGIEPERFPTWQQRCLDPTVVEGSCSSAASTPRGAELAPLSFAFLQPNAAEQPSKLGSTRARERRSSRHPLAALPVAELAPLSLLFRSPSGRRDDAPFVERSLLRCLSPSCSPMPQSSRASSALRDDQRLLQSDPSAPRSGLRLCSRRRSGACASLLEQSQHFRA